LARQKDKNKKVMQEPVHDANIVFAGVVGGKTMEKNAGFQILVSDRVSADYNNLSTN
jgi:hypothetical protein